MNSQLQRLLDLTEDLELFRSPDGKSYATATVNDHWETRELRSAEFTHLLQHRYYFQNNEMPASQYVKEVIRNLQAKAQFEGPEHAVFLRVAEHSGRIYLDLANDKWDVVEIASDGWRIVANPAVKFRRAPGMQPLPAPLPGGSIDEFRSLTNLDNDSDWVVIVGALLAALRPAGPYPIVVLHGEHGSSKSTLARMFRALVDPSSLDLRAEPQNGHDLIIAASNSWVLSLDNLSRIPGWLSDALCRLATGGGHATRKLYSDSEEALFHVQRPVMINGIGELVTRGDLMSRCIIVELPPIRSSQRRPESQLGRQFDAAGPRILGALLDGVATGLKRVSTTHLARLPRMADLAVWVSAAEPGLGWAEGTFLIAYEQNQDSANELVLEASPITAPLFGLLRTGPFEGTAKTLLACLAKHSDEATRKQRGWPRTERGLRAILDRLAPNLRAVGVEISYERRSDRKRTRIITIRASASSTSSAETPIEAGTCSCEPLELECGNIEALRFEELRNSARDIFGQAQAAKDHKGAAAVLREWTRIEQLALERGGDQEEQKASIEAVCPPGIPLPGRPGGPPLTQKGKETSEEISKLSAADRMLIREAYTARMRRLELEAQAKREGGISEQHNREEIEATTAERVAVGFGDDCTGEKH